MMTSAATLTEVENFLHYASHHAQRLADALDPERKGSDDALLAALQAIYQNADRALAIRGL